MPFLPGTKESYIGALLENIIYGVYLSVFLECCMLFYNKRKNGETVHAYLLLTTGLMFILITTRCIIDTYHCIIAFDVPNLYLGPPNSALGIVGNACCILVTLVADVFIVFRTFILSARRWLAILIPSLFLLANFVVAVFAMVTFSGASTTVWTSVDWMNAFLSLTLCTNIICTGLIAFRIIQNYRQLVLASPRNASRPDSIRILSVVVESAVIYTAVLVATLIVARLKSLAIYILIDCLSPTIGLVFLYIIIRVSRGTSYGEIRKHESPSFIDQYSSNNRVLRSRQNISTRGAPQGDFEIKLERTRQVEVTDGAFSSDELDGPGGTIKV
ncbi:hypothetical protein DFH08DRAFT_854930 [Mycena albidolilacea]|uniref:Uncharacterized protein n=1 Tax=Mycena albidolilacea TaxID=1033008 RepID=A0AAD7ABS5_9AGAR|nr:hypothetical protein DFH08DRAFT_854930 [Mycena albidolilacea]